MKTEELLEQIALTIIPMDLEKAKEEAISIYNDDEINSQQLVYIAVWILNKFYDDVVVN